MKKKYLFGLLIVFLAINYILMSAKADGTYSLSPNQSLRKDFHGKEGVQYTWKIRLEMYGNMQRVILDEVQFENRKLLIWESECYSISSLWGGDAGYEKSGSFTVPYESTWYIFWVNRGLYSTIITLYDWKVKSSSKSIGIDIVAFLMGFMCIGIIIGYKRYNSRINRF